MHAPSDMAAPSSLAWALPFIGLLLSIAIAPLLAPHAWHRHYGKAALLWALAFVLPDAAIRGARAALATILGAALEQYLPFILLLGALFTVAGGLRIKGTLRGTPAGNSLMLAIGAGMASVIGTTGATMVMLRPVIRANRHRAQAKHVFVFFILLVANIGGALTPLGDPPLFLGYLLGVPFFWPAIHLALPTLFLAAVLLALFYGLDRLMHRRGGAASEPASLGEIERLGLDGKLNLALLAATVAVVLLRAWWNPPGSVSLLGVVWTLGDAAADVLLALIAALSLVLTPAGIRKANDFTWEPMREVAILFAAIFVTLQPVMAMIAAGEEGPLAALTARLHAGAPDPSLYYWTTGALSAVLDNAPTYVVFFGFAGGDPAVLTGPLAPVLAAISGGAVYFGAMSYIGNAPNFMAKAMVESQGIKMPSFFGFLGWSCLCLLPWLAVLDLVFFRLWPWLAA